MPTPRPVPPPAVPAAGPGGPVVVVPVTARDPEVLALVDALTAELALGGYAEEESFGYSAEQLAASGVRLVAARAGEGLVGLAGLETDGPPVVAGELKRFYVAPAHRGTGVADALLDALEAAARDAGARVLRLETGDAQAAALRFYARRGFRRVPAFGPYVGSATSVCLAREL
ncbi:GNAT family N-acetyltransferase [Pseudokineococcus lusitanus]|uniref:Ribosomal protein S18 acetylase RimI-like enzyme n=1 Tax=Pseudokineococcus lusitanus TaxID=763993 RepID=A0A3N1HRA7_9ACTN|nr:GNAT family N-acetyltransferase [Pseudokineococcus lusitanus]ROP45037.1 ribosomal protein S18 acetylase RimI-like enzyme [Pseudokineococcus lusitanus]